MVGKMNSQKDSMSEKQAALIELANEQQSINNEIRRHFSVLAQNGVGMNEPLVDSEGFPRNDIDVAKVRHSRHNIICLRNDMKDVMKRIEDGLLEIHAEARGASSEHPMETETTEGASAANISSEPIARVKSLIPQSPAFESGLQSDDLIFEFGSVNSKNFTSLEDISRVVTHSVNIPVNVTVQRGYATLVKLTLVPKRWSGIGLLGCTLLPLEHVER